MSTTSKKQMGKPYWYEISKLFRYKDKYCYYLIIEYFKINEFDYLKWELYWVNKKHIYIHFSNCKKVNSLLQVIKLLITKWFWLLKISIKLSK